ncbi:hypothetical protein CSOJ01_14159 [Colletotrichum sojae]|uniref:Uncharacterized protein n=1 Tax=Colletotrichum sojae TaxID=2175907 RepID=A0A8H6MKH4_9PEZI|nr:hypothetical protein CSOJ01_14159 [Colletotrichum sojae]
MAEAKLRRPHQRLVQLLFLASASSAATIISIGDTSLSLSNFQLITQLSVPLGCLLAYNNPIAGCTANDFKEGSNCSNSCRRGLSRMQTNLQDACEAVQVQTNTLLGQALAGNLINLLCPSTARPTSAAPPVQPSPTSIVQPSSTAVIPPPPPPPPPATTTAQTIPVPATTSVVIPPSSPPPANPPSSTAAPPPPVSQLPPPLPPLPAPPTTVVTSTATSDAAPQSTSAETKKPEVNPLDALLMSGDSTESFKASRGVVYVLCLLWASILAITA